MTYADELFVPIKEEDLKLIYDSPTELKVEIKLLNDNYKSQGFSKGAIGIIRDIKSKNGKWEVEFGDTKLMLVRDEIEVVK